MIASTKPTFEQIIREIIYLWIELNWMRKTKRKDAAANKQTENNHIIYNMIIFISKSKKYLTLSSFVLFVLVFVFLIQLF